MSNHGLDKATRNLLTAVERNMKRLEKIGANTTGSLGIVAFSIFQDLQVDAIKLRAALADFDEENTTCPLCGQPRPGLSSDPEQETTE